MPVRIEVEQTFETESMGTVIAGLLEGSVTPGMMLVDQTTGQSVEVVGLLMDGSKQTPRGVVRGIQIRRPDHQSARPGSILTGPADPLSPT